MRNPEGPQDGTALIAIHLLSSFFFTMFLAAGLVWTWTGAGKKSAAISSAARPGRTSAAAPPVLFGIFALAGALGSWYLLVRPLWLVQAARTWSAVPCTILSSEVGSHDSDDGTTYSVDIVYRYERAGRTYESDRFDFLGGSSSGYRAKAAIVHRYPPGSERTAWVDPAHPDYAVLERGFRAKYLIGLLPLLFLVIGTAGLAGRLRARSRPRPEEPATAVADEIVLLPGRSPRATLAAALVFATVWNGIVSVFVWQTVGEWGRGALPIFRGLFLLPFVVVGLLAVGFVIYRALALRNPRPSLVVRGGPIEPGATLYLEWRLQGDASRLADLRIRLVGREEATYTRGTTSTTAKETFADLPVLASTATASFGRGEAFFTIPAGLPPSFDAPRNKIAWLFRIEGSIARWPDLDEELPITVTPAKVAVAEEVPA